MTYHLSCFYSFKETVIIRGYVDTLKNLVISEFLPFEKISIDNTANILKIAGIKPYINQHDVLSTGLNGNCVEVSFAIENEEKTNALLDMFHDLKENNRIIFDGNIKGDVMIKAFQLLLEACRDEIYKTPMKFTGGLGTVVPRRESYRGWRRF